MTLAASVSSLAHGTGVVVVGASGQVGGALMEALADDGIQGTSPTRADVDLERAASDPGEAARFVVAHRPKVVYLAAGMTHVDGCERDPARAMRVNCDGPAALARAVRAVGGRTVYFSTEYVFDGEGGPYAEGDRASPVSAYGASKLAGEEAVRSVDPAALIIRTTVVYGPETQGKNFAYQLATCMAGGRTMRVPVDQVSTPSYNRDLARATLDLAARGAQGIFHVAGMERLDRVAFARRLAAAAGLDARGIDPVTTAALGQAARRPLRAGLRIDKLLWTVPGATPRTVEAAAEHWCAHPRGRPWPMVSLASSA